MMRIDMRALSAMLILPALVAACSGDVRRPPPNPTLTSIAVMPATAMLEVDAKQKLNAVATYSDGTNEDVTNDVTWSSDDEAVATILPSGEATAVGRGSAVITATLDDVSGSATLTVTGEALSGIGVYPATADLEEGMTIQLTATATFADDSTEDVTTAVTWSSSDESVARVSQGLVTSVSAGTAVISAADAGGISGQATVTVRARAPIAILVAPSGVNLPVGQTQQFTATAEYAGGDTADVTSAVMWTSSSTAVAGVNAAGLATALADGFTSITARHSASGVSGSVSLRVSPAALLSLTVTPTAATIGMGSTQAFRAMGDYTDGSSRDLTSAVTWNAADPAVATISNMPGQQGLASAVGAGTTQVSAMHPESGISSDDSGGSATLTVTPASLMSIVVVPNAQNIPLGLTQQYQAVGLFSDNSSQDMTAQVTWSSTDPSVAPVDASGLATSVSEGTTTISATDPVSGISSDDAAQSGTLTVDPPALVSIAVTPSFLAMVTGNTQQFTANGSFSDGSQQDITLAVSWSSSNPGVLPMAPNGEGTALAPGNAIVSATDSASGVSSDDSNQSAAVTIANANLVSIAVTPTSTTVPVGAEVQLVATGTYDNLSTADLTNVVQWSSTNGGVAPVENTSGARGIALALGGGATTIAAVEPSSGISSNDSGQSATLNVDGTVTLSSIAVQPASATIDVDDTFPFKAVGTFSNGASYAMTNVVTWTTSSAQIATISNTAGTRGLATGTGVGGASIRATDPMSGISSMDSGQDAALTVNLNIVTVDGTYPGPTVSVDGTADYGVSVGSVTFSASDFPSGASITDVNILIDFLKTDGSCAAPLSGSAYHGETSFRLEAPDGTRVVLASTDTWSGNTAIQPVAVTFDQAAAMPPSGTPVTGTFQPNGGNLDSFNGLDPVGTWVLQAGDTSGLDPLCVISYTITITAQ